MQLIGPPKNRWGWARIVAWAVCALVLLWTLLDAILPGLPFAPVLVEGLELAVIPLLLALAAGWLEDHYHQVDQAFSRQQAGERAAAEQRRRALRDLEHAVADADPASSDLHAAARAALPALDGPGKGAALRLLHERGLLNDHLDLRGVDLSGAVLTGNKLPGIRLAGANLHRARIDQAALDGANLAGASLSRAFLRGASLRGAVLAGCDLTASRLDDAGLAGADLREAALQGTFLIRADLTDALLSSSDSLDAAVLIETILPGGDKATNERGKEYLRSQELATLVDKL